MLFLGQLILFRPLFFFFFLCYQCLTGYNRNFVFWSKGCTRFFFRFILNLFFLPSTFYFLKFLAPLPLGGFRQLPNWSSGRAGPEPKHRHSNNIQNKSMFNLNFQHIIKEKAYGIIPACITHQGREEIPPGGYQGVRQQIANERLRGLVFVSMWLNQEYKPQWCLSLLLPLNP